MKPLGTLLPFEEAKEIVNANIKPVTRTEIINIDDSAGRTLAEEVIATTNTPPFDRASMDGYAVKARDTSNASQLNPRFLNLTGELHAGATHRMKVNNGECIQIATGAMMPDGGDAVVIFEDTEEEDKRIKVFNSVSPKANVTQKGADIKEGEFILRSGSILNPGRIGLLASQGISQIRVYEKPRVAIIPTGEEICEVGKKLSQGQVYNINSHTISSVVQANGGTPIRLGITGDDIAKLKSAITEALNNDLVIISGGSSVGRRDLLTDALQNWGKILFHGVRIKPGKPILFGKIDGKPVFGIPGFATSCLVTTHLFVAPAIRKMAHLPPKKEGVVEARLSQGISRNPGRRQFFTVRLEGDSAIPVYKESGAITSMSQADGYIEIADNVARLEKDKPVTVRLF